MSLTKGPSYPLLRELVERRRKLRAALLAGASQKDAADVLDRFDRSEDERLTSGAAARPISERLLETQFIAKSTIEGLVRAIQNQELTPLTIAEQAELRKALAEPGMTPETAWVAAGLATPEEIAYAYAEYLRLPMVRRAQVVRMGEMVVDRFSVRGLTQSVMDRLLVALHDTKRTDPTVRLGQMLVKLGLLTGDELDTIVAEQEALQEQSHGIPINQSHATILTESFCREHLVVPIHFDGKVLRVAMANPTDMMVIEEGQQISGYPLEVVVATVASVREALDSLFGVRDAVRELVRGDFDAETGEVEDDNVVDLEAIIPDDKDARIVRLANSIIATAIVQGASDIHLEPFEKDVQVRYRIDGQLIDVTPPPKSMFIPLVSRYKILSRMDIAEKRIPQDGAICTRLGPQRIDLRVNVIPTVYGEKMVMRLLRRDSSQIQFDALGFNEQQVKDFRTAISSPHGLLFVTGPTGSGKSTTLYAALHELNKPTVNLNTVEDPVEQKIDGVNQVHVRSSIGLTFGSVLRALLRQDPDVIMVGEVRDRETAEICMRAALTGHFVLSTLHTNDALSAIPRLTDMGVERFLLTATLRLLEAQRLLRRICATCAKSYALEPVVAERVGLQPGIMLRRPVGCKLCRDRGYRGRVGIYEVIPLGAELVQRIQRGEPTADLVQWARGQGQKFLADAALAKATEGITSLEEAMTISLGGHG